MKKKITGLSDLQSAKESAGHGTPSAILSAFIPAFTEAGAVVLPAMPGFYSRPQTLQDAVDHVAGKVMSALGFEQDLFPAWDGGRRS